MHWMTKAQSKILNQYSFQPATGTNGPDQWFDNVTGTNSPDGCSALLRQHNATFLFSSWGRCRGRGQRHYGHCPRGPRERPLFSISVFCRSVGSMPLFDSGCTGIWSLVKCYPLAENIDGKNVWKHWFVVNNMMLWWRALIFGFHAWDFGFTASVGVCLRVIVDE